MSIVWTGTSAHYLHALVKASQERCKVPENGITSADEYGVKGDQWCPLVALELTPKLK